MAVAIRALGDGDMAAIAALNAACVPEVGAADEAELAALAAMSEVALVAERPDAGVVGFCIVLPPGTEYSSPNYRYFAERFGDFAYLDRIAVDAHHRGRGIGAALHAEIDRTTAAAVIALEINVDPPNEASMRFHERLGFVELERRETRPGKTVSLQIRRRVGG